jgi:hypothetical protein
MALVAVREVRHQPRRGSGVGAIGCEGLAPPLGNPWSGAGGGPPGAIGWVGTPGTVDGGMTIGWVGFRLVSIVVQR